MPTTRKYRRLKGLDYFNCSKIGVRRKLRLGWTKRFRRSFLLPLPPGEGWGEGLQCIVASAFPRSRKLPNGGVQSKKAFPSGMKLRP